MDELDPFTASKYPSGSPQRDKTVSFEDPPAQEIVEEIKSPVKLSLAVTVEQATSPLRSPVKLRTSEGGLVRSPSSVMIERGVEDRPYTDQEVIMTSQKD